MTFNKTQFVIKKRKLMKQNNVLGFDIIKLESHLKQRQRIEIAYCCFFLIFSFVFMHFLYYTIYTPNSAVTTIKLTIPKLRCGQELKTDILSFKNQFN